jgi:gluconolactonase
MRSSKQYVLEDIVHIRGVDHPESISVGPRGEAYTTGTGGQVYRLNLDENTAEQFASTAPRRVLGQAVDADGNLYCADTTGAVITIAPDGRESVYATGPRGQRFQCTNYPAFDSAGNLYVSDSGNWSARGPTGHIYKVSPGGGEADLWHPAALMTPNGIALDAGERYLYVVETFAHAISRIRIREDGAGACERVVDAPRWIPDGIAFDEDGDLWIACHRPDAIYVLDVASRRLVLFAEDWKGHELRGPTDVAFAGPGRDILLASSLDNLVVHRFENVGVRGLPLHHPSVQRS